MDDVKYYIELFKGYNLIVGYYKISSKGAVYVLNFKEGFRVHYDSKIRDIKGAIVGDSTVFEECSKEWFDKAYKGAINKLINKL